MSWHQIPFVRLLIPLIVGIITCSLYPEYRLCLSFLLLFLISSVFLIYWAFAKKLSYSWVLNGSALLIFNLFLLGYILYFYNDSRNYISHFQHFIKNENIVIAKIVQEPVLKTKTVSTVLKVESISDSSVNFAKCSGKILASFELDSNSAKYQYGDLLILNIKISKISGPDTPNSFDASTFYALSDVYHQAYIKSDKSKILGRNRGFSAQKLLIDWRKYLSSIFERHLNKTPNEKAVAEALVLGVRSDFSPELKNAYADTGATHVLSVSGLHVGLVAGLLGWLIKRSRKRKNENFNKKEIAILLGFIWFYVLLTGASASVLRSGLRFSFVLLATMLRRKISVYNSLAASAFALLCMQPKFLYDIGFQLSYLALFGIVFFHPHIYRCLFFKNKAANWAWNLTAVGIAAQLVTLPISLYYFHQFPTYFWLSGLAVIPLSTLALYSGIALLVFDWIPFLAYPIAQLTYYSLALMNASIFAIQNLPFAVIGGFWVGIVEMLLLYLFIFSLGIALLKKSLRLSYLSLGIAFTIFLLQSIRLFNASNQEKIVVYKVNKSTLIEF